MGSNLDVSFFVLGLLIRPLWAILMFLLALGLLFRPLWALLVFHFVLRLLFRPLWALLILPITPFPFYFVGFALNGLLFHGPFVLRLFLSPSLSILVFTFTVCLSFYVFFLFTSVIWLSLENLILYYGPMPFQIVLEYLNLNICSIVFALESCFGVN